MKELETRVKALERARGATLPTVHFIFEDGSQEDKNALDAFIYMTQLDAGKPGLKKIRAVSFGGQFPSMGTVWKDVERDLKSI